MLCYSLTYLHRGKKLGSSYWSVLPHKGKKPGSDYYGVCASQRQEAQLLLLWGEEHWLANKDDVFYAFQLQSHLFLSMSVKISFDLLALYIQYVHLKELTQPYVHLKELTQ